MNFSPELALMLEHLTDKRISMKPLIHPAIENVPVEAILYALADPVRAALFGEIMAAACSKNCITLASVVQKPIPKSTLSQHMRILREAGLIRSERHGTEIRNTNRCEEMEARYPGLLTAIMSAHAMQIDAAWKLRKKRTRSSPAI